MKCQGCGIEEAVGPTDVQPYPPHPPGTPWRVAQICEKCAERLDMDMWISTDCWKRIDAVVPFDQLTLLTLVNNEHPS